jgi:hypothetical protein
LRSRSSFRDFTANNFCNFRIESWNLHTTARAKDRDIRDPKATFDRPPRDADILNPNPRDHDLSTHQPAIE